MAHRRDGRVRIELERESHSPTRRRQTADRARLPRDEGLVQGGLPGLYESTRDDFGRLADSGVEALPKGEAERETRVRVAPDPGEPISHETLVRDVPAAKILHRPSERSMNPFERDRKSTRLNSSHSQISYA